MWLDNKMIYESDLRVGLFSLPTLWLPSSSDLRHPSASPHSSKETLMRRVVVTGWGSSSIGNNKAEVVALLRSGKSGIVFSEDYKSARVSLPCLRCHQSDVDI